MPHLNEVVVDSCPIGQEEAAARGQAVKEEELLLGAQQAVVPLLGLLHSVLVGLHAVLVREGDAIHTLQRKHEGQVKPLLHMHMLQRQETTVAHAAVQA